MIRSQIDIRKTCFCPSCDSGKLRKDLFLSNIGRPILGMKLLEGVLIRYDSFIKGLSIKRAFRAVELTYLLPRLRDPQSGSSTSILYGYCQIIFWPKNVST